MDPNLLPQQLRGQEQKELIKEKRGVSDADEILSVPERYGRAAIDDESFRLSRPQIQAAGASLINVSEQKDRHEALRQNNFGSRKIPPQLQKNGNWHVPAEHAMGDSWINIIRHPFGGKKRAHEFYLSDAKRPEASSQLASAAETAPERLPLKTPAEHEAEIHRHFSSYLLIIALPPLFAVSVYLLYLLLSSLPPPFNLSI